MAVYPIVQTVVTKSILFGSSFILVIIELAEGFSEKVGYQAGWFLLGFYLLLQLMLPIGAAFFAWAVKKRLNINETN